jgi:two-component system cell cycle sensor histidine kinase PleC
MPDRKPSILIVDDVPSNIYELSNALLDDYEIIFAISGQKAILLALEFVPDIILLDVMMPVMNGYEVCQRLKSEPRTSNIPVIFVTARDDPGSEARGLDLGAVDFITKPANPAIVRARVRNHLTQRRIEEALRGTARRLSEAERLAHVGAWEWNIADDTFHVSEEWLRIHGCVGPSQSLKTLTALTHPEDRAGMTTALTAAAGAGLLDLHYRILRPSDGTTRIVHVRGQLQRATDGLPLLLSGATQDITDQKLNEIELARIKDAAEAANQAKSAFLTTMSHELRTPLTSIIGFSEIMRDQCFGPIGVPVYAEYAGDIHESGLHLLDLINDILDIAKIESGKMTLDRQWIDVPHLLSGICRLVNQRALRQELEISVCVPDGMPRLWADERAVKQIVFNLLSNAIKFTPKGGGIAVAAEDRQGWIVLRVTDTGVGIPSKELTRVLRPFEQIENHYSRAAGGTGLGLPLIKGLIELHGGVLTIESEVDSGTMVEVSFPPRAAPADTWSGA